jgi:hypothetical protein
MSNDRSAQPRIWEDKQEEEEALETDYQSLMTWWKKNPSPDPLLAYEMLEMITKAKFWVWYFHDQDQDKRILDMKDFLQHDFFYDKDEKVLSEPQKSDLKSRRIMIKIKVHKQRGSVVNIQRPKSVTIEF